MLTVVTNIQIVFCIESQIELILNLGHSPLYRHFYKCLYIEMLKILLVY